MENSRRFAGDDRNLYDVELSAILQFPLNIALTEFRGISDSQFLFDILAMCFNGVNADKQSFCNGPGRDRFADQTKNLQSTIGHQS